VRNFYPRTFICSILLLLTSLINAQVNTQDSTALVNLYNSTRGPSWKRHDNWLSTFSPLSTWYGVTVTNNRVTGLSLNNNLLEGILPPALGNLTALDSLSLSGNILSGSISSSLYGNLTSLVFFNLSSNLLNDSLPSSLENLSNLKNLNLSNNRFSGIIPSSFGNLSMLQVLNLSLNRLGGNIPSSFSNLSNLDSLDLSYNSIKGNIPSLSSLSNLINLNLAGNILTGSIPASLGNLGALQSLDLSENLLSGDIPSSFGDISNLRQLLLYENELNGDIPSTLNNLTNLQSVNLSYNQLSGNIPSFSNSFNLNSLYLNHNQLTGNIPSSFSNLTNLQTLDLSYNQLNGAVPSLESLSVLVYLNLSNNQFTFSGIESVAQTFSFANYAPQSNISLHKNGDALFVSAGGTLSNNSFRWYKNGILDTTITGDSVFTVTEVGQYSVAVTNSIATELILYTDSIDVTTLPVQLISFTGSLVNNNAVLTWKTAQEINTSHYNILRSEDAVNFSKIGEVKSANNSNVINYTYTDASVRKLGASRLFYRLQEVDNDGKAQLSNIISLDITSQRIAVYPNPASNFIYLDLPQELSYNASLLVYNISGKEVLQQNISGSHQQVNVSQLSQGTYYLLILQNGKASVTKAFVVVR
jgi:Leucine-rich repeat (LRR) protein